jgi:CDP-diacylglycerol---serine O-phosphatidyltransferase
LELPNQIPDTVPEKKARFRRGVYILPSLFTVGTLVCGYFAILATLRGIQALAAGVGGGLSATSFDNAAKAIGWAFLFDGLDGRLARLTNSSTSFGREFDSLADVITFGVAPALLAYGWGIRAVDGIWRTPATHHLGQVGWIVTFAYLICGAARLARFNIDTVKPSTDHRYFVGLPIPAAAVVIAAVVHWQKDPLEAWYYAGAWLVVVALLAFLMVSRMRFYSFKAFDLRRRRPFFAIIVIGLIIWGIWYYSEEVLLTLALTYLVSGFILRLISRIRPHPPSPEEVHAA